MSRRVLFLSAALLAGVFAGRPADAQTIGDLFDSGTLQEARLFINSRDFAELRARYEENRYYPADFLWRGIRVRNVGVRVRGLSTRSASKPALNIEFDHYIAGQTFLGLHSLILRNALHDPAVIRERTSMAFIDRIGQPACRESLGRLYINGIYHGVYAIEEAVDADFLARTMGDRSAYLFDYKWITGFRAEDLGDSLDAYKVHFEAQTHQLEPDSILYSPIRDLFREVNHDVDGVWRDRVGEYIDLPQLVAYVAAETFLAEGDGFLGSAGMANFYLYRSPGQNMHRLLHWDRDSTFEDIERPIFLRADDNMLFRRAMAFADLRSLYLDVLEQCARAAAEDHWLEREVSRVSSVISAAVYEDVRKLQTNDEYDQAVAFLLDFAARRSAFVLAEVAKARAAMSSSQR